MKRLILTALDWTRPKDPPLSLGHASILANLLKNGVDTVQQSWSVNHENFQPEHVVDFAMNNATANTDFGIGAFVWNEIHVQTIIKRLKAAGFPGKLTGIRDDITIRENNNWRSPDQLHEIKSRKVLSRCRCFCPWIR